MIARITDHRKLVSLQWKSEITHLSARRSFNGLRPFLSVTVRTGDMSRIGAVLMAVLLKARLDNVRLRYELTGTNIFRFVGAQLGSLRNLGLLRLGEGQELGNIVVSALLRWMSGYTCALQQLRL